MQANSWLITLSSWLGPGSAEDLLQDITTAKVRKPQCREAPQVQRHGATPAPAGELAAGQQDAEQHQRNQR